MSHVHIRCSGTSQQAVTDSIKPRSAYDETTVGDCPVCERQIALTVSGDVKYHKDLRSSEQRRVDWDTEKREDPSWQNTYDQPHSTRPHR